MSLGYTTSCGPLPGTKSVISRMFSGDSSEKQGVAILRHLDPSYCTVERTPQLRSFKPFLYNRFFRSSFRSFVELERKLLGLRWLHVRWMTDDE